MSPKAILVFCAQALLTQSVFSQIAGVPGQLVGAWNNANVAGYGLAGTGLAGIGCGCGGVASTGGGLPVASASACPPTGVSVLSENAYEGRLCAGGNLPFLGSVAIEGTLPTAGAGAVSYGCGNGAVGIATEGPIGTGITGPGSFPPSPPSAYNPGFSPIVGIDNYGYGLYGSALGNGCGCL